MGGIARLKRRAEFLRVAEGRRKWVAPGLILQVRRHAGGGGGAEPGGGLRVGFTASRKVGMAVLRNRARRRLKAVVDEVMPAHAAPGHDYVLIARAQTVGRPFSALLADLETALRRLDLFRDDGAGRSPDPRASDGEAKETLS